jgi:NAD(P)-dependent dehydrogenase (short-subunit alcohol dehydrogenase family)
MQELTGKVAVVTGAASGIGRALADRFAAEGMKLVLADLDEARLAAAAAEIGAAGVEVVPVKADVSRAAEVEGVAKEALRAFGAIHVVCNNAGVTTPPGPAWEKTLEEWELVLGVNLWGVIHGIRVFVPILLAQGAEAHVVNTASAAGLVSFPFGAEYLASKHAVVAISEGLHLELALMGAKVKVSVLCPAFVKTRIIEAADARPCARARRPELRQREDDMRRLLAEGMPPAEIAERVIQAIREERFYVLPHDEIKPAIEARVRNLLEGRNPAIP